MTNRRRSIQLAAIVAVVACLQVEAAAKSFIWKATGRQGVVYLVGSVHLLTASYYPLDPVFEDHFKSADLLVEELDMGEMLAPTSQMAMLNRGLMPVGQTLDKVVSAETLQAVEKKLAELGMPAPPMKQFKPWMLALTLQALQWQKAGFDADLGLDKHFYDLAKRDGKQVQGLETLNYQISRFDDMPADLQDRMLAETLKELESTEADFVRMADAWKRGDLAQIESLVLDDLKTEPRIYQRLLVERNQIWLPKIEALFSRPRPTFVVVGAAHLMGADGLLQMLKAKGYTVEQL